VVAEAQEEDGEDTSEDDEEVGTDTSVNKDEGFSGSMEPPLLVDTEKDAAAAAHLQHWHRCRDHMAYKEPIGAKARRQLVLFLKGCLPVKEFDIALTLVHGVSVARDKAFGNNHNNNNNNGDGRDLAPTNNKRKIGSTPAGLQEATKKACFDPPKTPPADTTWGKASMPAVSTWVAPGASWGSPVPKVTPAETKWAERTKCFPVPQQPHSHGRQYQNGHFLDKRNQGRPSPLRNDGFQRQHSPPPNKRLPPTHSPDQNKQHHRALDRNQHHHQAPHRSPQYQPHRPSHYMNEQRF
jgi:hypothetical protein